MQTQESVRKALRGVKDPELNLNIIDIGLVSRPDRKCRNSSQKMAAV